jgi:imidazoleglycerol-phosphate dehydratase
MLTLFSRHGFFDLTILAKGDVEVDFHHMVEDVGICLGEAFRRALGDMKGSRGTARGRADDRRWPRVTVDISARPHLVFRSRSGARKVGSFDVELVEEFFRAFAQASGACVHVNVEYGSNAHHTVEAVFKAFGRAMCEGVRIDPASRGCTLPRKSWGDGGGRIARGERIGVVDFGMGNLRSVSKALESLGFAVAS